MAHPYLLFRQAREDARARRLEERGLDVETVNELIHGPDWREQDRRDGLTAVWAAEWLKEQDAERAARLERIANERVEA